MVPQVKKEIGSDSLLNRGTWAFLGSSTNESNRYLFWTSVDTDTVGAGNISETITAARSNKGKSYVAIADHINSFNTFKDYTTGTKYDTLAEAYAAYKERVENDVRFQQYKNTLPE